ncbi:hypothetical protein PLCT2_02834 [Planctomycetaceae bacterium]|jgi:hypothetical protein|nr:hypothetical protein PLCT2_02834 [Planctomycetaceae bacterium]
MQFKRHPDGSATLETPQGSFKLTDTEFDDLVHAVPINTTAMYRLLNDTLVEDEPRVGEFRKLLQALIKAANGKTDPVMTEIQNEILKHVEEQ